MRNRGDEDFVSGLLCELCELCEATTRIGRARRLVHPTFCTTRNELQDVQRIASRAKYEWLYVVMLECSDDGL